MMAIWLEEHGVESVVLAGYMHLLTPPFLARFPDRIVNVHPSLLRPFPGAHAIDDALAAGVETTGVTIHLVDEDLDTGRVLRQEALPVEPRATLEERIHAVEHRLLPEIVAACWEERLRATDLRLRQGGYRHLRARPRRPRFRARLVGRHRLLPRGAGPGGDHVEEVTKSPEMLGGRVKTLHPRSTPGSSRASSSRTIGDARRARDRAVRRRLRQPLPVHSPRPSARPRRRLIEMIDVGGPSMLRGAAKNFVHVAPVCRPEQYDPVVAELREGPLSPETRRASQRRPSRSPPPTTRRSRAGSRGDVLPRPADADLPQDRRPRVRREPAPDRGVLRGGRLAQAPALAREPARRPRALVQQPRRSRRRAADPARVRRARRGDREARQPLRRRGRGHDRPRVPRASPLTRSRRSAAC